MGFNLTPIEGEESNGHVWDNTKRVWNKKPSTGAAMTGAQIKTAYEAESDTNAFNDKDKIRLYTIQETNAYSIPIINDVFGDNSTVSLYEFSNNTQDSLNANHLTSTGNLGYTTARYGKGIHPTVIDTNPNSAYVEIPKTLLNSLDQFSISMWFNPKTLNNTKTNIIFSNYNCDTQLLLSLHITPSNKLTFLYWDRNHTDTPQAIEYSNDVEIDKWMHVAIMVDKTNHFYQLHINGSFTQKITHAAISGQLSDSPKLFGWVANCTSPGHVQLDGTIDQVRILNRLLTNPEVISLTNETSSTASTVDVFKDESAIALYEYNDDLNDTGGVFTGSSAGNITIDGVAHLDGSGYIHTGIVGSNYANELSVSLFFYPLVKADNFYHIVGMSDSESYNGWRISRMNDGKLRLMTDEHGSAKQTFLLDLTPNENALNHLCVKIDKVTKAIVVYLNMQKKISITNGVIVQSEDRLVVGNASTRNTYFRQYAINGYIDQVRVFNRIITDAEVLQLATEI